MTGRTVGGSLIPDDAALASPKLTIAFGQAATRAGAQIKTGVTVTSLIRHGEGSVRSVKTSQGEVACSWVVFATNAYTGHLLQDLKETLVPTRGQAFLTAPLPPSFPFTCAANYDLEYWRQTRTGQILFGGCRRFEDQFPNGKGTESNETTPEVQAALRRTFDSLFPTWSGTAIEEAWAGTMAFTLDHRPLIGYLAGQPNLLIAAGFSGNCLPLVCVTGELIREIIMRGSTSLSLAPFDPDRFVKANSA